MNDPTGIDRYWSQPAERLISDLQGAADGLSMADAQRRLSIPAEEVVPGDVVLLSAGSLIPADGMLLEARDFYVNQAVLTGETFPVEKRPGLVAAEAGLPERTNCVFMGTNVRSGSAHALIVQFDYLTFDVLLFPRAKESAFQTGWFLESVLTELLILLVIRTRRPFFQSMPGRALLSAVLIVAAVTVVLPYSPLGKVLGFVRLPLVPILVLLGISVLYVLGSELAKRVFYARVQL